MEAFEREPAFPPHLTSLTAVKAPLGIDAAGGSPSSSTSCHDSHLYHKTTALQATEQPLPVRRRHHFRKNSHLNKTTSATPEAAAPEAPNEAPEAQLAEAKPADKRLRRKPTKQWEEEDIRAPGPRAGRRKAAGSGPALRSNSSHAAAVDETEADAHSPMSDASAKTRRTSSPRAAQRRQPSLDAVSQEDEQHEEEEDDRSPQGKLKRGGPCHVCWVTESPAWRTGQVEGLFPGAALCNRHGTLDRRNRLGRCCDAKGIVQLHGSGLTDEEKAAASKEFLKNPRTARKSPAKVHRTRPAAVEEESEAAGEGGANARSRVRRKPVVAAKRQGWADAGQPWGATSPGVKATGQAAGGRKRKAPSGNDGDDAAAPAMASQKRLCFERKPEPAVPVERDGRSNKQLSSCEHDSEEVEDEMDIDKMAEKSSDVDEEMGGAVAGLLTMRGSGSSEWTIL